MGIIPARGGSRGVPKKNTRLLGGKPLVAWTIEKAKKAKSLNRLVLSTDSEEIAEIAEKYGAEVPFLRPAELARDDSPTIDVIRHCLEHLKKAENYSPDAVVILQPTTPFRKSEDIDKAIALYFQNNMSTIVSVSKVPGHYNPEWQLVIDDVTGVLTTLKGENLLKLKTRRQLLRDTYYRNGEIYVFNPNNVVRKNSIYGDTVTALITETKVNINIDTDIDFECAEFLLERGKINV